MAKKAGGRSESERQALLEDMQKCLPSLKAFAISLSGNVTRAEDLVQETVARAVLHLPSFQTGTNMPAWLFTILRNLFRSEYRKLRREVEDPDGTYAATLSTGAITSQAEEASDFNRLLQYMACLAPEQRDALIAIGYLQLSYEDAADRLGCAVGTIKSRVNRARNTVTANMRGDVITSLDVTPLRTAAAGVPESDPYYVIAKGCEDLYANVQSVGTKTNGNGSAHANHRKSEPLSQQEQNWQNLVASGALAEHHQGLDELMEQDFDEI